MSHNKPGSNPHPIELVEHISCPVLGNYGAEDRRINAHLDELVKAMVTYKKTSRCASIPTPRMPSLRSNFLCRHRSCCSFLALAAAIPRSLA